MHLTHSFSQGDALIASPTTSPINSLEQLLLWRPGFDEFSVSHVPLKKCTHDAKKPKTMVCHDMKGGYIEDRYVFCCHTAANKILISAGQTQLHISTIKNFCNQFFSEQLQIYLTGQNDHWKQEMDGQLRIMTSRYLQHCCHGKTLHQKTVFLQ